MLTFLKFCLTDEQVCHWSSCKDGDVFASVSFRRARIVDEYFIKGARVVPWMGSEVIMYHRTIEEYYSGLQQAGFTIQQLRESRPRREQFSDVAEYQRRLRIPLFLFFATAPHPIPY